jgi:hypothetical protein
MPPDDDLVPLTAADARPAALGAALWAGESVIKWKRTLLVALLVGLPVPLYVGYAIATSPRASDVERPLSTALTAAIGLGGLAAVGWLAVTQTGRLAVFENGVVYSTGGRSRCSGRTWTR